MKKPQETSFRPLLACIIMQLAMGMLYGWSVLLAPLEQSLEASRSEVSLAYSLAFIFVTIGCFVTHRLLQIMKLPKCIEQLTKIGIKVIFYSIQQGSS